MLLFKKRFLPSIRAGKKTQTIRIWPYRRMKPGQRSYIPGVGHIRVLAVEPVRLEELTDDDATRDGFQTVSALREELAKIYAEEQSSGQAAFRVRFCLLPGEEKAGSADDRH